MIFQIKSPLPTNSKMPSKKTILVLISSILITAALTIATWEINFWPSDERVYYYEAAIWVPQLQYISQINQAFDTNMVKWLHGKEMFILSCSIIQGLLNDYDSIRPFILVCILSLGGSLFLIYLVSKNYWGENIGLVCYGIFATSFWPYVYVLFVKHQPLGLFYFLFSLYLLQAVHSTKLGKPLYFFSGFFLCSALFSSTVSAMYFPFYIAAFLYGQKLNFNLSFPNVSIKTFGNDRLKNLCGAGFGILVGFLLAFIYFNYPDILDNVKGYFLYVHISGAYNHFYYNQPVLRQWMDADHFRRAGWLWVVKYFFLVMPIVFPFYLACVGYLLKKCWTAQEKKWERWPITIGVIFLSMMPTILAEVKGVAQYGANYFPALVGFLFLIGYTLSIFFRNQSFRHSEEHSDEESPRKEIWFDYTHHPSNHPEQVEGLRFAQNDGKKVVLGFLGAVLLIHVIVNVYVFASDVYPTRMATTFLSKKIEQLGVKEIYTYRRHPQRVNLFDNLNPKLLKKIRGIFVENIYQSPGGYMLVPPMTGNSIYIAMTSQYSDFDRDIFFNELIRKGNLKDYAVVSYKTLASSRIWPQEEEILSYRYLILNQFPEEEIKQGKDRVWLLDVKKLREDFRENKPRADYVNLVLNGIRNIGTKERLYIYPGDKRRLTQPVLLNTLDMKIFKVGEPSDGLRAYVYRVDSAQPLWVPLNESFASEILDAKEITQNPQGTIVHFKFPQSQVILPGPYQFVIYRTGEADDKNFYRIYLNNPEQTEGYIKAAARPMF